MGRYEQLVLRGPRAVGSVPRLLAQLDLVGGLALLGALGRDLSGVLRSALRR